MRVLDAEGRPVVLGARLGRGGEGEVYEVPGAPGLVAKVFHPRGRSPERGRKLEAMIRNPPAGAYDRVDGFPVLTWPRAILYDATRRTAGYLMDRVEPDRFVPFYRITSPARRQGLGGHPLTWDRLVLVALRLCHLVRTLERFDYAIGDLNDRNLLVSRRLTPLLMDTDSFQVPRPGGHHPCVVGDQTYWPPEHLEIDYATFQGSRALGDRYALAVLLFQLFMGGCRPYQARGSQVDALDSLVAKTKAGHYPWAAPRRGVLEPPASAPRYDNLPPEVRSLFERAFVKGHTRAKLRPTAAQWYNTLLRVHERGYRVCPQNDHHTFGKDLRACPWCRDPNDPFATAAPVVRVVRRRRPPAPPTVPTLVKRVEAPTRPRPRPPVRRTAVAAPARSRRRRTASPTPSPALARRILWCAAVTLACATPLVVLPSIPLTAGPKLALFVLTASWIGIGLWWTTRSRVPRRRALAAAFACALTGALLATLLGVGLGWHRLDHLNAALAAGLGIAVFLVLERRSATAFVPRPRGVFHASLGLTSSYAPVAAVWLAGRL